MAVAIGILLVLAVGTTLLPIFVGSCPYKTPVTSALPWLFKNIDSVIFSPLRNAITVAPKDPGFRDYEPFLRRSRWRARRFSRAIAAVWNSLQIRSLTTLIRESLNRMSGTFIWRPRLRPNAQESASDDWLNKDFIQIASDPACMGFQEELEGVPAMVHLRRSLL